jgi:Holliday junction resolvasome RuvABC endonuclease subunit
MSRIVSLCLGLDVSPKRLGWALARLEDGAPVACGMEAIELPANGWDRMRMREALTVAGTEAWNAVGAREIHYVAIELPALVAKSGPKSAFMAGRAYQEAISAARRRWPWAWVDEMQPSEWRRLAGLKGNASKDDVKLRAAYMGFPLPGAVEVSVFETNLDKCPQDAADAACIAVAGVERNRQTLKTLPGHAAR